MSANGDTGVGKQAEVWRAHCVFILSLYSLCLRVKEEGVSADDKV